MAKSRKHLKINAKYATTVVDAVVKDSGDRALLSVLLKAFDVGNGAKLSEVQTIVDKKNGFLRDAITKEPIDHQVWKANAGPIPKGYIIYHLNGNKLDNTYANLMAMPRAVFRTVKLLYPNPGEVPNKEHILALIAAYQKSKTNTEQMVSEAEKAMLAKVLKEEDAQRRDRAKEKKKEYSLNKDKPKARRTEEEKDAIAKFVAEKKAKEEAAKALTPASEIPW